ncbi:response regulator [Marinomonas mediterranea]|uniref:Two component transcriptional regulator, LuxR family n=1 Tax=Marinomonas mediterranea (strain ATCC 700492 / JCM 21426 / NBRC 103028 / MMB-1) TaxID=717774 RepID=F2JZ62_MARM1|nr:response regulator [Marinomonas mediterranea]ADZ92040.1 two component transcriptional regulator, LuxR family [Marinomonas mediterranea MMB-1]WCN10007.1 response regulator [Marinomonas mediterranea]WCN14053.1 response regulator [Marinomonas mediterranea]WCN18113.1 response regulator [Marinomonas mediterranea MMB-1]
MHKILIVDDHDLVCEGLKRVLQDAPNLVVIGVAHSGEEALEFIREEQPNIVLMDVHMPGIGGLGATVEITRRYPSIKIVALSAMDDNPYPTKLIEAGASGYVTKGAESLELLDAIDTVSKGERYISKSVAQKIALAKTSSIDGDSPLHALSERELQVAQMIVDCKKSNEIADQLNVSPKTVSTYRARIFSKLNIESDVELARLAMRYNILGLG